MRVNIHAKAIRNCPTGHGGHSATGLRPVLQSGNMARIPELSELLPIVANAGEAAARMQKDIPHWIKDDGTPVSDADIATEKMLLEGLPPFGISVLSGGTGRPDPAGP